MSCTVSGYTSPRGTRYIQVQRGEYGSWQILENFADATIFRRLAAEGIIVISRRDRDALLAQVSDVNHFPLLTIAEQPGWTDDAFVLPDHTVFAPNEKRVVCAFPAVSTKCAQAGSLKKWTREVARPMEGQRLAIFVMCTAFVPPLLKVHKRSGNVGYEIVGPKGAGKSTLQYLASSALGSPLQGDGTAYWITFNSTMNAFEAAMALHADMPMYLEEAALFLSGETPAKRARGLLEVAFRFGAGNPKARYGHPTPQDYSFIYVSTSNEPLADLIGHDTEVARAAADRLMTIRLPANTKYGIFERVPKRYRSSSEFASAILRSAEKHHGKAFRAFIKKLVKARANDEKALRTKVREDVEHFLERNCTDRNNGSTVRVAEAFGLVYSAGVLAQAYGALPDNLDVLAAVQLAYKLHQKSLPDRRTFSQRLAQLADHPRTLVLDRESDVTEEQLAGALAIVRTSKHGKELLILPDRLLEAIPEWRAWRRHPDCLSLLLTEDGHQTIKRRLRNDGTQVRVYCFLLECSKR